MTKTRNASASLLRSPTHLAGKHSGQLIRTAAGHPGIVVGDSGCGTKVLIKSYRTGQTFPVSVSSAAKLRGM